MISINCVSHSSRPWPFQSFKISWLGAIRNIVHFKAKSNEFFINPLLFVCMSMFLCFYVCVFVVSSVFWFTFTLPGKGMQQDFEKWERPCRKCPA